MSNKAPAKILETVYRLSRSPRCSPTMQRPKHGLCKPDGLTARIALLRIDQCAVRRKHKTMPLSLPRKECAKRFSVSTNTPLDSSNLDFRLGDCNLSLNDQP